MGRLAMRLLWPSLSAARHIRNHEARRALESVRKLAGERTTRSPFTNLQASVAACEFVTKARTIC